ncbi:hypothetical protein H5P28_16910 [Ruficoccus amylovorans]|uniref:Uncharacterized protein n=1 Tax=Ruficoccus amylovorans TaxID=1804625 RepID=A0A842HEG2_9BACT|nr:hypothetical protein [Ruficoccus amylovorans]MBC2594477.1 hypothetical protein [Ruficoccus amylovorans]MBC2594610.1 hypothetical protein [Ruficoccus amylovorans]MBC2595897.1 hypothetical protein [Ruficoccus amylovorans]MBC2595948.1 hypothetical protein [Ruficoccus amylovorans]
MIQAIVIAVVSVGAGLLMLGNDKNEPPPPPAAVVEQAPFVPLANALYWVGGCSVACSLIWGRSIVRAAQCRRQ